MKERKGKRLGGWSKGGPGMYFRSRGRTGEEGWMREGGEKNEGEINKERKIRGRDDGEREEGTMGERKMREEEGRDEEFECGRTNSGAEKKYAVDVSYRAKVG